MSQLQPTPSAASGGAVAPADEADLVAPDCRGMNFFEIDRDFQALLELRMAPALLQHLRPHLLRLGEEAGGRLDELAETADRNPPVLRQRDRFGRDEPWIEYHPAYREMERIAFGQYGLHAMSHRGGVLDWPEPMPPLAKYAFQYLFVQAEFGLMCPVSVTDTSIHMLIKFGSEEVKQRFLPRMLSQEMGEMWKGTQFLTEKSGGSDVGAIRATAVEVDGQWRLHGEKWFCSHTDADVVLLLARPEGAVSGTRGLALFAMPWRLEDGSRNRYRIVRLKDKLGTRSMASGEILLEGAVAYPVGELDKGLKQMMNQVNLSRLSHGVRAASMMRRCLNESLRVARHRVVFDKVLIHLPLMRRQLIKLMVPTEQALSFFTYTAVVMEAAAANATGADGNAAAQNYGGAEAVRELRILTPLLKFRTTRDNIQVATGAMEARGGNGYIEEWINSRLVRDAQVGLLWEGTSNINALDVITRAVRKERAHETLAASLHRLLGEPPGLPASFRARLAEKVDQAVAFADRVGARPEEERLARAAASALYHAASAVMLAWEGATLGGRDGDARRLLLARFVLEHRLAARDPLSPGDDGWEGPATDLLLAEAPVPLAEAAGLVA